jgi:hypothetical protein
MLFVVPAGDSKRKYSHSTEYLQKINLGHKDQEKGGRNGGQ